MKQKTNIKILKALVSCLYTPQGYISRTTDLDKIATEVNDYILHLVWYIKGTSLVFLWIFDCFYPFFSREFCRFSRSGNRDNQIKYVQAWGRQKFYWTKILFQMIFSITNMIAYGQKEVLTNLSYQSHLEKKLSYD